MSGVSGARTTRLVWDLPVRMTHWLLATAVVGSYVTSKFGIRTYTWHKFCGYVVLVLVTFRVIWGFVGTRHARFADFLRGPKQAIEYVRSTRARGLDKPYVGHNPLGGWSVLTMLLMLLIQAITGLFASDQIAKVGPLFGWGARSVTDVATAYHHYAVEALEILVGMHIIAIGYHFWIRQNDLLTPMLTGGKSSSVVPKSEQIRESRITLALIILLILVCGLVALLQVAPQSSVSMF